MPSLPALSARVLLQLLSTLVVSALAFDLRRQSPDDGSSSGNGNPVPYALQPPPLTTPWTDQVGTQPWPQYPRPKLQRPAWATLNGLWTYRNASGLQELQQPPTNQTLDREVLVPSCLESGLSGIQGTWMRYSWFRTSFAVPADWSATDRVLLNFAAVDYEATVFVNGRNATFNRGGYFSFAVDVTEYLSRTGLNELLVFVHDPTDSDDYIIPIGKQTLNPSHIFYRPCSGIWQSVWIEAAPAEYITQLDIDGNADGILNITATSSSASSTAAVEVTVRERGDNNNNNSSKNGTVVATYSGTANTPFQFSVPSPRLWTPDSPSLYDVTITLARADTVSSYTGFRTIARGDVAGIQRILLNGRVLFPFGTLDQGYWPDGVYTPPTYDGMVFDLQTLKQVGMNMLRKHIKVESALYYQACDEIGLLVIQDMPALRPLQSRTLSNCTVETLLPDADQQTEFQRQLEVLVTQLRSYTCIFTWVIYNEGWGQIATPPYPEFGLTDIVRELDPTRLIDATSGWYDHGAGDYSDNHHYANPQCGTPFYSINSSPFDARRLGFQGEFGGIGNNVSIEHLWNVPEAIATINQTYEVDATIPIWNYRAHVLLAELLDQVNRFACSGAVWTQTTDVEGEVNGLLTYDRRLLRPDVAQWQADVGALYSAAAARANASTATVTAPAYSAMTMPWPAQSYGFISWAPAGPRTTTP